MRDPARIQRVLGFIQAEWSQYPDMRLGQLLSCVIKDADLFNVEDDVLMLRLREWREARKMHAHKG